MVNQVDLLLLVFLTIKGTNQFYIHVHLAYYFMFCLGKMKGLSSSSYMYNVIGIFPKLEVEVSDSVLLFFRNLLRHDRRSEPRTGERVPYVIIYGCPGLPLIQLVRQPGEVLSDPALRLNATYYITKQILPPLDRVFSLLGVDVFSW